MSNLWVLMDTVQRFPRRSLLLLSGACLALLSFGMYLQHLLGLEPCPMCIVQRYALASIALVALLASCSGSRHVHSGAASLVVLLAGFGAFVAARQSWLQWYPPEVSSCGRDFFGMIEAFPLQRALPMIFRGGGDCTKVDWTFLGGSIANWSFVSFCIIGVSTAALLWRRIYPRVKAVS